jgi:geranylgeranyl diphosphate synthase type I
MLDEFPESLLKYRTRIDAAMRQVIERQSSGLRQMMEYHLGWTDEKGESVESSTAKRVRPTLCILACEALGGDFQTCMPNAVAVELIHNFSLIHDDIQDGSPERHNRSTVWWLWGPAQAINAGDSMHTLAHLAIYDLREQGVPPAKIERALKLLDLTALELCEGQYLDIDFQDRLDISVEAYLHMASLKTGALIACALQLGALVATDDEATISAFGEAGRKFGIAFQIHDDLLDLWTAPGISQPMPPGDILSKKKTLPVIYSIEHGDVHQKRQLGTLYMKRVLDPTDVPHVLGIMDELGAKQFAESQIVTLWNDALETLETATTAIGATRLLKEVAEFLIFHSR